MASGVSAAASGTSYAAASSAESGTATAAPAGDTCLKDAAAGSPVAARSSRTSCHAFAASRKLMYPGVPLSTVKGAAPPTRCPTHAGFWCGLQPYFSGTSRA